MTRLLVPLSRGNDAPATARDGDAISLTTLSATVRKALLQFYESGRLVRLPNKLSVQQMTMWAL